MGPLGWLVCAPFVLGFWVLAALVAVAVAAIVAVAWGLAALVPWIWRHVPQHAGSPR